MKTFDLMSEQELKDFLNALGTSILCTAKQRDIETPLFALLVFNAGDTVTQYVSNASRSDIILAFREAADRFEKQDGLNQKIPFAPGNQ